VKIAATPIGTFNTPEVVRALADALTRAGASTHTRTKVIRTLSAVLSWAAHSSLVPELQTNGALLAGAHQGSRRRSVRRGGAGLPTPARIGRRHGAEVQNWALSPLAVEHIRARLLTRQVDRNPIVPYRDAMIVSLQFGLACRNQEAYGLRWGNLGSDFIDIIEVLSWGEIDEGKTAGSTPRRSNIPSLLVEDLATWKATLSRVGYRTEDNDFIIAGNLAGEQYGKRDPRTGGCHFTKNQATGWGSKYLRVAVNEVAKTAPA
jgi:integrase